MSGQVAPRGNSSSTYVDISMIGCPEPGSEFSREGRDGDPPHFLAGGAEPLERVFANCEMSLVDGAPWGQEGSAARMAGRSEKYKTHG
ncbi:hypothetical protein D187_003369 [Cystobacter fuscus DSM 2262]|uniref:Uncharacterized protein n=1 Tax=Cystobacter fuscus (strain ATCC 25194 / DSM 2262 / NBRC 100088 / M29) TaxID=1242864 RepID=S9P9P3_CYSF2|nr:hypothetical protein D187_003369 [Cystobacter fuscus DSM 2262]